MTGRRSHGSLAADRDPRYVGADFDSFLADFARSISEAGGLPVYLPFEATWPEVLRGVDAVVLSGGQDVHPTRWGGDAHVDNTFSGDPRTSYIVYDPARDTHEIALARGAVTAGVPVLGVCRGTQVLDVALGGTLVPHLEDTGVEHLSPAAAPHDGAADHVVRTVEGSLAHALFGASFVTNSWHHQAVAEPGPELVVTGRTPDGVAEIIELPGRPVLGVQWHPEWQVNPGPVFVWLVAEAARAAARPLGVQEGA
ncbi:gamma-glutamyl-gamma-aminobutyrate hydrolase family protein [Pseudonocardia sp. GCM10023141]|uniref:gamma-glutamyl-gamma-aminobutyrate hydrolase family protein n=1 Tax=Pseudonocardia sp. GCM10023141 TaxID=3252653 RepID=UPI00361710E6